MKVSVKNLGVLKQAEFKLGDLTLICGKNNTGKTYATYALFGFLRRSNELLQINVSDQIINDLQRNKFVILDIEKYTASTNKILKEGCHLYSQQISEVFAAKLDSFRDTSFEVTLKEKAISSIRNIAFESKLRLGEEHIFSASKEKGKKVLIVSPPTEKIERIWPNSIIKRFISDSIVGLLFKNSLPNPFIASAERTGAAIFRKELDFSRNRLLKEMIRSDEKINPIELLFKSYQEYPSPVEVNVDFIRGLGSLFKKDSFLVDSCPQLLNDFADIIGGEYIVGNDNAVYFKPLRTQLKLTMHESSSAVRSLLDIGFYLRHVAKPGDLLMIDEPELNLHPENQRRMARLFARLVNLDVRVFVTTHSDYIVKELSTLIMLNQDKPYLKRIAKSENYKTDEFISAEKIRVYIAKNSLVKLEGNQRRTRCQTLVQAKISEEMGIDLPSFDNTINNMNKIQEAIFWGEDTDV